MPFRISAPLIVVAGFVAAGLLVGRSEPTGDPNVIKVVSSLPRSGSARGQTDTIVNGIRVAFEEAGNQVELTDPETKERRTVRIEYLDLDDATAAAGQWTIEQEIANANQAKADPDVMVYIGTYNSGAARVSMPILNRAHMLMISPANTAPSLTQPRVGERHEPDCYRPSLELDPKTGEPVIDPVTGKPVRQVNYTRVVPTDDLQGELSARWIKELTEKAGNRTVYILDDNEVYGKGIADLVHKVCDQIGVRVLGQESIDSKAQEFKPLMQKIKGMNPGLIYFGGTTQTKAGQLFKDMISVGMKCPMMAPDGCYETAMIESAGTDAFERAPFYATFGGVPVEALTTDRGKRFIELYARKFGTPPTEAYSAYGYECGMAALEAIRRAGRKDRDAIRRAGVGLKDIDGTVGKWSFDANGDTSNQVMSGNRVDVTVKESGEKDGKFKFVTLLKRPSSADPAK